MQTTQQTEAKAANENTATEKKETVAKFPEHPLPELGPLNDPPTQFARCAAPGDLVFWRPSPMDFVNQKLAIISSATRFHATVMEFAGVDKVSGGGFPRPKFHYDCPIHSYASEHKGRGYPNGCFVPYVSLKAAAALLDKTMGQLNEKVESLQASDSKIKADLEKRIDKLESAMKALTEKLKTVS